MWDESAPTNGLFIYLFVPSLVQFLRWCWRRWTSSRRLWASRGRVEKVLKLWPPRYWWFTDISNLLDFTKEFILCQNNQLESWSEPYYYYYYYIHFVFVNFPPQKFLLFTLIYAKMFHTEIDLLFIDPVATIKNIQFQFFHFHSSIQGWIIDKPASSPSRPRHTRPRFNSGTF